MTLGTVSMDADYSCRLNEVKRLEPELTARFHACLIQGMAKPSPSNIKTIGRRLQATREALGILKQGEFAKGAGIATNTYNQWEWTKDGKPPKGRPDIDYANRLCERYGLTLDWIYRGDPARLPKEIVDKLSPEILRRDFSA